MQPSGDWSGPPEWRGGGSLPPVAPNPAPARRERWGLAIALFVGTLLTTTTLGADWVLIARTHVISPLPHYFLVGAFLSPSTLSMVWSDPRLLATGLRFALPVLFILLCHELGHYLMCRRYRIDATPPFFLPAPLAFGTFGAFIRIRAPIPNRRQLFDVGVAGPIAGFVALLPFLVYGIAHSEPKAVALARAGEPFMTLLVPGQSLLTAAVSRWFHGALPEGVALDPHPFVLAAWVGLLATSLNLLPLSQLDGGHILYAAVGRLQWRLALPLWVLLVVAGYFFEAWWVWALIILLIGLRHPPVRDEGEALDGGRVAVALLAAAILVVCFMPVPLEELALRP